MNNATLRERALSLHEQGRTQAGIARELGVHPSTVSRWFAPRPTTDRAGNPVTVATRGRVSTDVGTLMKASAVSLTARKSDATRDLEVMNRAGLAFDGLTGAEFIKLALRVSPEISRAVWDFQRMLNPGHEVRVFRPGTEDEDPVAQAVLEEFIDRLGALHGDIKVVTGRIFLNAITRGAFFSEVVVDDTGTIPVDLVIPDPEIVEFRTKDDPDRGRVWEIGQRVKGMWESLDTPLIRYIPLDPEAGSPYGRSILYPAVFPAMFLVGLMYDLRRVVAQQGYQRADVSIDLETLGGNFTEDDGESDVTFDELVAQTMTAVTDSLKQLQPDDAFVHTSAVSMNTTQGAIDASSLSGADTIISAIERMLVRALKTMPLIMGLTEGASEAHANREWEIYARTLKELQQYAENMLEYDFETVLHILGYNASVEFRFAELRYAEEMRDAQTLQIKLANAAEMERLGYTDAEEASTYAVGHPPTGEVAPPPLPPPVAPVLEDDNANPEPGADRLVHQRFIPVGAEAPLPAVPASVTITDEDIDRARGSWNRVLPDYRDLLSAVVIDDEGRGDASEDA